jgi:hypothetical protein
MLSDSGNRHAGRVRVTTDRLLCPTRKLDGRLAASMLQSGMAAKEADLPKKILLKT